MRNALAFAIIPLAIVAIVNLPHSAQAADAGAVLGACDRTAGCGYSQNKDNGDISGCSKQACFYCPADGKHQCFGVGMTKGKANGKPINTTIGGIAVERGKVPPKGAAGLGTVKTGGAKQAGTNSNQKNKTDPTANQNMQMQHSTSGGSGKKQ